MPNGQAIVPYRPQPPAPYYPPYQPPIIYTGGGGKGGGNTALIIGIVALTLVGGGFALWYVLKKKPNEDGNIANYDISVEVVGEGTTVPKAGTVQIDVTVKNKTDKDRLPKFRFDIWPSGKSPNEGDDIEEEIPADETVTFSMYRDLPSDWAAGKPIHAKLMLIGTSGSIWNQDNCWTISGETDVLSCDSVVAINPTIVKGSGERAQVTVHVTNLTNSTVQRSFRLDIIHPGQSPQEGDPSPKTLSPGDNTFTLSSKVIPPDWGPISFAVKIQDMLLGGPFWGDIDGSETYRLFTIIETAQALSIGSGNVVAVNPNVTQGDIPKVKAYFNNNSNSSLTKQFRLDTKSEDFFSWDNGLEESHTIPANASNYSIVISSNNPMEELSAGRELYAKIQIMGDDSPIWESTEPLFYYISNTEFDGSYANGEGIERVSSTPPISASLADGDYWLYVVRFQYRGKGGTYKVGLMLKYADRSVWVSLPVVLSASSDWITKTVTLNGSFHPGTTAKGHRVEGLKAIQELNKPFNNDGTGMLLSNWDWLWYVK